MKKKPKKLSDSKNHLKCKIQSLHEPFLFWATFPKQGFINGKSFCFA